jgi:pectinesterase
MVHIETGVKLLSTLTLLSLFHLMIPIIPTFSESNLLDDHLKAAEVDGAVRVVRVRKDGTGDFKTITDAVNSIPSGNMRRVVVWIGMGEYREKITVDMSKRFVTFYGERNGNENDLMPIITYHATALHYGTLDSATVAVDADYFVAVNVAFVVTTFIFNICITLSYFYFCACDCEYVMMLFLKKINYSAYVWYHAGYPESQ